MDPQKLASLDPKLRAAYERVMGVQIPQPHPISPQPVNPPVSEITQAQTVQAPQETTVGESIMPETPKTQLQQESTPIPNTTLETPKPESISTPPQAINQTIGMEPNKPSENLEVTPNQNPQVEPTNQSSSNFVQLNSELQSASNAPATNFSAPVFQTGTQAQTAVLKKKGNILMPIMIGITILVFIVVYFLFWARIFNFKLPFIPEI